MDIICSFYPQPCAHLQCRQAARQDNDPMIHERSLEGWRFSFAAKSNPDTSKVLPCD
jgi:hypothetical protein